MEAEKESEKGRKVKSWGIKTGGREKRTCVSRIEDNVDYAEIMRLSIIQL